jgi:serine/threonine-protein kinase
MELIGRRFGHIRVTEVVGQGGMGDVYGGYDEKLERRVALKVLNSDQRLDDEARERLLREARALSKLEHPNICRIHDYIESADVDLLVLEYIDGRTLHEAMYEKMPRSEKLRIAIAIAEVLIKAHRAGIVHRDLKPENVMLTRTGEVKVLDFGLARWLHRTRAKTGERDRNTPARLPVRAFAAPVAAGAMTEALVLPPDVYDSTPSSRPELATAVGITLGTPIFMSPEQARGESLTPASDMFSFGLLLQSLFTGSDPHPEGLSAREIILRVARGTTLPVQGAPGDVTTLINRLKQFAPADRPTALETLERLRLLADKPQRIARRALFALVVLMIAGGAWRYTVDLKAERAIAVEARAEADRRRAQAEDLIEFMLGDLRQKLEPVGRLDVLDDVAERALAYTSTKRPEELSSQELLQHSKALHQLAQVRIAQGKLDDALASAKHALVLTNTASKRDAKAPEVQLASATSHFWIGNVHRLRGDLPAARGEMKRYMQGTEKLAAAYPDNDEYRLERAYGHSTYATVLEAEGKLAEALAHYRTTMNVKRARVAAAPDDTRRQTDLAVTMNKVAFVLQSQGALREARAQYAEELAIHEKLVRRDPNQKIWQQRLANAYSHIAALHELLGDDSTALQYREREVGIWDRLHKHDAVNVDWHRNSAIAEMRLGDLQRRNGDVQQALRRFERAESVLDALIARDSSRPQWRRDRAFVQAYHARALAAAGARDRARAMAKSAVASLSTINEDNPTFHRLVAESSLILGDTESNPTAARAAWQRAAETLESMPGRTSDPVLRDLHARALTRLGRTADAQTIVASLASSGYRHRDLARIVTGN